MRNFGLGDKHSLVHSTSALQVFGENIEGQAGIGYHNLPVAPNASLWFDIQTSEDASITSVCSGKAHTCASLSNGRLYCSGANEFGELGLGYLNSQDTPREVPEASSVVQVACASHTTCYVDETERVYCFGLNDFAQ